MSVAPRATYELEGRSLDGADAEIVSVLRRLGTRLPAQAWVHLAEVLDPKVLPEARVIAAEVFVVEVVRTTKVGVWLRRHTGLAQMEFDQEFYSGYRDHTVHSVRVFLLGLYLYGTVDRLRTALDSRLHEAIDDYLEPSAAFFEWWTIAAFWHDNAYYVETLAFGAGVDSRRKLLERVALNVNSSAYSEPLAKMGVATSDTRAVRRAGRDVPWTSLDLETCIDSEHVAGVNAFLRQLGLDAPTRSESQVLDELTRTAVKGRPGYSDHGLWGGIVLAWASREALDFLKGVSESKDASVARYRARVAPAADDFEILSPLCGLAVEAISYHNLNWSSIDRQAMSKALGRDGSGVSVSLADQPHVFFLGLVDTLQDWERHHFVPESIEAYRKAVRAESLLVQGTRDNVRVSRIGRESKGSGRPAHQVMVDLLAGWLAADDVKALLADDADYSFPDALGAPLSVALSEARRSEMEYNKLTSELGSLVTGVSAKLVSLSDGAVLESEQMIRGYAARVASASLMNAHRDNVEAARRVALYHLEENAVLRVRTGTVLGLGVVESELGRGGFGAVHQVRRPDGSFLAFKLFNAADLRVEEKRRLFERGYRAMEALARYPNVVSVVKFSDFPMGFYMDYVPGQSLDKVDMDTFTYFDRLGLLRQIFAAVAYAHGRGVLHRDLKPGNVLIDSSRQNMPVLTDFDLAWVLDERSMPMTEAAYATNQYGAPELFDRRQRKWHRKPTVDIYGMGALAYFVLTGENPPPAGQWDDGKRRMILASRLEGHLPAYAVRRLVALIDRMVVREPEQRQLDVEVDVLQEIAYIELTSRGQDIDSVLDWPDFVTEIVGSITGVPANEQEFTTFTGAVSWRLSRPVDGLLRVHCQLLREPRKEGVNYEGFVRGTTRQVDARCREFSDHVGVSCTRHGDVGRGGSGMRFDIVPVTVSRKIALEIASFMGTIGRIIE